MQDAEHGYDGRPIRRFVPILVEREVIEVLSHQVHRARVNATSVSPLYADVQGAPAPEVSAGH